MSTYPWAGFGSFKFRQSEMPLPGTDSLWTRDPARDRRKNLGSVRDSIRTLAIGSADRSWEALLEPDRFDALEALTSKSDTLTDWKRPVPDSRPAYLAAVKPADDRGLVCTDNDQRRVIRARIEWISL